MKRYFITGIGTGVGKTVLSAILCEALKADYWKPIQAGDLEHSDTVSVKKLVSNTHSIFHPEAYQLTFPLSPHASAEKAGITIDPSTIQVPQTTNHLIIEGAGGLMVPLNRKTLYIDLIPAFNAEVILVSKNYLGSINHTLLSAESLMLRNIPVRGIVFNGEENPDTESIILEMTGFNFLGRIPQVDVIDSVFIQQQAAAFANV
jgi:dethiobiotin synthetase